MTLKITKVKLLIRCGKCSKVLGTYESEVFAIFPGDEKTRLLCLECKEKEK